MSGVEVWKDWVEEQDGVEGGRKRIVLVEFGMKMGDKLRGIIIECVSRLS